MIYLSNLLNMKHKNEFSAIFQKNSWSFIISSILFHIEECPPLLFSIAKLTFSSNLNFVIIVVGEFNSNEFIHHQKVTYFECSKLCIYNNNLFIRPIFKIKFFLILFQTTEQTTKIAMKKKDASIFSEILPHHRNLKFIRYCSKSTKKVW